MVICLRFNNQACFFDVSGNLVREELSKYHLRTLLLSVPHPAPSPMIIPQFADGGLHRGIHSAERGAILCCDSQLLWRYGGAWRTE